MDSPRALANGAAGTPEHEQALVPHLAAQVETLASSERELRRLLNDAHEQIGARDEEIRRLLDRLERERAERDRVMREAAIAHEQVASMRRTRLWRAGALYWSARDRVRRRDR